MSLEEDAEIEMALAMMTTKRLLSAIESRFEASMFVGVRDAGKGEVTTSMSMKPHPAPDGYTIPANWGMLSYLWHHGYENLRRYLNKDTFKDGLNT